MIYFSNFHVPRGGPVIQNSFIIVYADEDEQSYHFFLIRYSSVFHTKRPTISSTTEA